MGILTPIHTIADIGRTLSPPRLAGRTIGLVPTMGSLHRGHMALVDRARAETDVVVVSIFVNPTQFGAGEDLAAYPRDLAGDLRLCAEHGVDCVFAPGVADMYPRPMATSIEVAPLSGILIGRQRPGHFQGVATVVAKLFNIVRPHRAYFGEKDFQQLTVVRRMTADLSYDIEIVGVPTVREADGLACSSRNVRLSPEDRKAATVIVRALRHAKALAAEGETRAQALAGAVSAMIAEEKRASLRSVDVRRAADLEPIDTIGGEGAVVLITARFGDVLLIDQTEIGGTGSASATAGEQEATDERAIQLEAPDGPGHSGRQGGRPRRRADGL